MMYLFNSIFGLPPSLDCLLTHIHHPSAGSVSRPPLPLLPFLRVLINAFVRVMAKCGLRITGRERKRDAAAAADWVFGFERTNEWLQWRRRRRADSSLSLSFIGPDHPEQSARAQSTVVSLFAWLSNPEIIVDLQGGFERVDPQKWNGGVEWALRPLVAPSFPPRSVGNNRTHSSTSFLLLEFLPEDGRRRRRR